MHNSLETLSTSTKM